MILISVDKQIVEQMIWHAYHSVNKYDRIEMPFLNIKSRVGYTHDYM